MIVVNSTRIELNMKTVKGTIADRGRGRNDTYQILRKDMNAGNVRRGGERGIH